MRDQGSADRSEVGRCRFGYNETMTTLDAVVVGAGPNGLVAANLMADRGWDVLVLEAEAGGAVRSGQVTAPGFVNDLFSAFYPLLVASPVVQQLDLERFGLRWSRPEPQLLGLVLGPFPPIRAAAALLAGCGGPPSCFGSSGSACCPHGGWPRRRSSATAQGF